MVYKHNLEQNRLQVLPVLFNEPNDFRDMKKLTYMELKIINIISETFSYTFSTCEKVFREYKSFDKTIAVLGLALELGLSVDDINNIDFEKTR